MQESTVRGRILLGWGQLTRVEEVILDKDVLQMAIHSVNICGSMVQNVLSGDPLNVQRLQMELSTCVSCPQSQEVRLSARSSEGSLAGPSSLGAGRG